MVIIAKDLSSRKRELSKPLRRHKESLREESWSGDLERAWSKVAFVLWEACSLNAKSQNLHPICAAAHGSQVFQIFCRASSRLKPVRAGDINDFWTIAFLMSFLTVQWPLKYREKLVKEGEYGESGMPGYHIGRIAVLWFPVAFCFNFLPTSDLQNIF